MTRNWRILLPIAWMALLFWSSSRAWPQADDQLAAWLPVWVVQALPMDKVVHAGLYGVLAGLWAWALQAVRRPWRLAGLAWTLATIFGALDEVHQGFVPGRSRDPMDLLADATGAALAVLTLAFVAQLRQVVPPELTAPNRE